MQRHPPAPLVSGHLGCWAAQHHPGSSIIFTLGCSSCNMEGWMGVGSRSHGRWLSEGGGGDATSRASTACCLKQLFGSNRITPDSDATHHNHGRATHSRLTDACENA
jgi:hypothetical protein